LRALKSCCFPKSSRTNEDSFRSQPSGLFNAYVCTIGVKADSSVNFHSFRHVIPDAFQAKRAIWIRNLGMLGNTKQPRPEPMELCPRHSKRARRVG
jgi:hypothetical protein